MRDSYYKDLFFYYGQSKWSSKDHKWWIRLWLWWKGVYYQKKRSEVLLKRYKKNCKKSFQKQIKIPNLLILSKKDSFNGTYLRIPIYSAIL